MPKPRFLPGLLLLAACGTHSAIEVSREHALVGEYERAFLVLEMARREQQLAGGLPDEELSREHHAAKLVWLRERARLAIFGEREDDALADLARLEELSPGYPEVAELHEQALEKKAGRAVARGDYNLMHKNLQEALAGYAEAETIVPGFPPAVEGQKKVGEALAKLSARAQAQFLEAVRKMPEFRFLEVRWHADSARTNDPKRDDAQALSDRAQHEIALKAQQRGRDCLAALKFGAALLEFRQAQALDPELAGIADDIASAQREFDAMALMQAAERSMRSRKFDLAREQLAKAAELSTKSRAEIDRLVGETRRFEGEARYQVARDLEILGRKDEALAAFEALAKEWPEGLLDEKARVQGLRLDIETAGAEWAAAEAAEAKGNFVEALRHYETALQFYPGWKDGAARIANLRQKLEPPSGGTKPD
jgi:tetratricopeptide (TPR) repeat protein